MNAPPSAMPPRVDFFKKSRRLFSCIPTSSGASISFMSSESFRPSFFKNF